jgi:hypothetical protein
VYSAEGATHHASAVDMDAREHELTFFHFDQHHIDGVDRRTEPRRMRRGFRPRVLASGVVKCEPRLRSHRPLESAIDDELGWLITQSHGVHTTRLSLALDLHAVVACGRMSELKRRPTQVPAVDINRASSLGHTTHR